MKHDSFPAPSTGRVFEGVSLTPYLRHLFICPMVCVSQAQSIFFSLRLLDSIVVLSPLLVDINQILNRVLEF
jgi:hypothetical protein